MLDHDPLTCRLEVARVTLKNAPVPGTADVPHVMFMCVHNAGRSQMAAAWLKHLAGARVQVYSGGSDPAASVNAMAVEVMREAGIDMSQERPKPWTDDAV